MSKKNKPDSKGFVYSTDPNFKFEEEQNGGSQTLPPEQQKLRIWLNTRLRAGKAVTLIVDFVGTEEDLEDLGKKLKNYCGTGGSAKDGQVIIQGDHRETVMPWLLKAGYTASKKV